MAGRATLMPAPNLHRPPIDITGLQVQTFNRDRAEFSVLCSEKLSCFLNCHLPRGSQKCPIDRKKEAVVAKSKMALVADSESPQDATQNVISEPPNQGEISALAYELWIQRGCPLGSLEVDWFRAKKTFAERNAWL